MSTPILATKLYRPLPRAKAVLRPRLIERLNEDPHRKLTLVSAPAGFGKTSLVSEWVAASAWPVAWLSLDDGDNDPIRFLTYLVAALQTIAPNRGDGILSALGAPQPPPIESILTAILNEIAAMPEDFSLVLDDYHVIDAQPVGAALTFLLGHLPPRMHLIIATREDPPLPLPRLRGRGQLTELRAADLRFTPAEAAEFLNRVMGFDLPPESIAALDARTEGWIAGLQLAAISMQGHHDSDAFIKSFTGSHHFVMDYLIEEVLQRQPESVQTFLLQTSILDRLCGPLCDAVLLTASASSQANLDALQRANLFIVPLDNDRRWYRYHHLFADLLRQRLHQLPPSPSAESGIAALHLRASRWYEANGLLAEAFDHAVASGDLDHAARLVEGDGLPLPFRGVVAPVRKWLDSLPKAALDARPALWVISASVLLFVSQVTGVEERLQAAEAALQGVEQDARTRDLIGHIASIRATLAVSQDHADAIITHSRRALEYLHPENLPVRTATIWTLAVAYELQGDRVAASRAYAEAVAISQQIGHTIIHLMSTTGLGNMQAGQNQLHLAAESFRRALQLAGDPPMTVSCEANRGLANVCYEWNDLDAAQRYAQQNVLLARQIENTDRFLAGETLLARVKLARGDVDGASAILVQAGQVARHNNFVHRIPEIAAAHVLVLIRQGDLAGAAHLARTHDLPASLVRVCLAQGDTSAALAILEPLRREMEAKAWNDECLRLMVLEAVIRHARGENDAAAQCLNEALRLAAPGGFVRLFLDEGPLMARLLSEAAARGTMPDYGSTLLAAFEADAPHGADEGPSPHPSPALIEPLTQRELEVLQLIATGLSNHEIGQRLFIALSSVKGHNKNIFGKLQVQRRTEAVARARELGLLQR